MYCSSSVFCTTLGPWIEKSNEKQLKDRGRGPEGGGERELNQILLQELAYIPSSIPKAKTLEEGDEHTNEQCKNDPLKVTNVAEKEWDQLDTRLARYDRNRERTLS
jgi:hypothetical protein